MSAQDNPQWSLARKNISFYMKIIQLSDTHLLKDPQESRWNAKPYETLSQIIQHIKKQTEQPDIILLTGDLSQDDTPESYHHLKNLIEKLNIDTYFLPGNHDVIPLLEQILPGKKIYSNKLVYRNNWAIILLNTTAPGKISGILSPTELDFLKNSLNQTTHCHVMIAMHHHPIPLQTQLMDQYILENRQEFLQIINQYPQVKIVIFGHVHQVHEETIKEITYLSCPSTWVQLRPGAIELEIDTLAPGYRWLELKADSFITTIKRIEQSK